MWNGRSPFPPEGLCLCVAGNRLTAARGGKRGTSALCWPGEIHSVAVAPARGWRNRAAAGQLVYGRVRYRSGRVARLVVNVALGLDRLKQRSSVVVDVSVRRIAPLASSALQSRRMGQ